MSSARNSPQQINHLAFMKGLFYRKWFVITPLFAGIVISAAACFMIPPSYESYTLILVEEQKTINPLIQNIAVSSSVIQRMQTIREQLLGWNNLGQILHTVGLDKNVQGQKEMEDLIMSVRKRITVEQLGPDIVRLAYQSNDPQAALDFVKNLSELFIRENMSSITRETDLAIEFLTQQLEVYKRKIKESEIASLQDELTGLRLDATDAHPVVRELQQRISMARTQMESGKITLDRQREGQYRELMQKELEKIAEREQAGQPDDANTTLYKLFLMDRLDLAVGRDIEVNRNIYNMLLQRLETAKITQRLEASKQGTRYTIIDPPRLPLLPSSPNNFLVVTMGVFLGGGTGLGIAMGRQLMDQSFLDIEDARHNLDLPVLGAITRITTRKQLESEKDKRIILIVISLILSAALITGAGMLSIFNR